MPTGHTSKPELSAKLLEAQHRLLTLRQTLPLRPQPQRLASVSPEPAPNGVSQLIANAQKELRRRRELAGIKPTKNTERVSSDPIFQPNVAVKTPKPQPVKTSETVIVYPSLLLAMLKQDQAAAGRVYLILRYLDRAGRGWLPVKEIRERLTRKGSPLKVVGWRRLRQILHQGEEVFWQRDCHGRLWLRGPHKIAAKLDCDRLEGLRVELSVKALLGGIGMVRAHFYGTFHSRRKSDNPITREKIRELINVPERTQRAYDQTAGVERQYNIAVGPRYTKTSAQEQAWYRGRGMFQFVDTQGQQGPKNQAYVAWHLPNSYQGPHQKRCKGRQKKINRCLAGLVKRDAGEQRAEVDKLFWPNGAAAAQAYNRDQELDAFWQRGQTRRKTIILWYVLSGGLY